MVTTNTMDTQATVEQCLELTKQGCELIRITAPSPAAATHLGVIQKSLRERGSTVPLIADIHFMPKAAEIAARIVSKVRINPGNYSDRKLFQTLSYTPDSYQRELDRIYKTVAPLIKICKLEGTAIRIGCNHGSLSDRIVSHYGDTPLGMVESALEFVRICEDLGFENLVLSMKASNPKVMVAAYRLLVQKMIERNGPLYPLHLGVTEAGSNQEGRIKSAVGIGTLLQQGMGDTIRVSLTEDPEKEIPVAQKMIRLFSFTPTRDFAIAKHEFTQSTKRAVHCFGGLRVPRIIIKNAHEADFEEEKPDFVWNKSQWTWINDAEQEKWAPLPVINFGEKICLNGPTVVVLTVEQLLKWEFEKSVNQEVICVLQCSVVDDIHELIQGSQKFCKERQIPLVIEYPHIGKKNTEENKEIFTVELGTHLGAACLEGWINGIVLPQGSSWEVQQVLSLLQASRLRISRPDYISCPSCGRTQFDLQTVTQQIQARTSHLKGVKIGIMGCIVNGPGEMADADFGYVGTGLGLISLYRGKTVVAQNVPEETAVDRLIALIQEHGMWINPH